MTDYLELKAPTVKETYSAMCEASAKAQKASNNYNKLKAEIVEEEQVKIARTPDLLINDRIVKQRIDEAVDRNKSLKKFFSSYTFWTSEVARHSNILQGTLAYVQLNGVIVSKH